MMRSPSYELHTGSSSVGIVIGVILSLLSGTFSAEWGRPQYSYSPRPIFYIEDAGTTGDLGSSHNGGLLPPRQKRLVVYYGPTKECDLVGDPSGIQMHMKGINSTSAAIINLSHGAMKRLIVSAYFENIRSIVLHLSK